MGCGGSKEAAYVDNSARVKELEAQVKDLQAKLGAAKDGPVKGGPAKAGDTTVLWFPEEKLPCKFYLSGETCKKNERGTCTAWAHSETNLTKLVRVLQASKKTLDICVFTITCDQISDAVVAAHKRGVKVRVITDNDTAEGAGSDIQTFRDAGIEVRQDKTTFHMHHKFAVVDHELLINGSFNWSRQAVLGNEENVVLMRNGGLVASFMEQFERLWIKFA